MPFDPITVGTSENDATGIKNREAWAKVNAMLLELFTAAGGTVTGDEYAAAIGSLTTQLSTMQDNLANKLDIGALETRPINIDVISHTVVRNPPITGAQKIILAQNTGNFVTLRFDLIPASMDGELVAPASITMEGDFFFTLGRLPNNFQLYDVQLCATRRSSAGAPDDVRNPGCAARLVQQVIGNQYLGEHEDIVFDDGAGFNYIQGINHIQRFNGAYYILIINATSADDVSGDPDDNPTKWAPFIAQYGAVLANTGFNELTGEPEPSTGLLNQGGFVEVPVVGGLGNQLILGHKQLDFQLAFRTGDAEPSTEKVQNLVLWLRGVWMPFIEDDDD